METVITDLNFKTIVEQAGSKPIVLDFSATWCGPCQKIKPYIHELAQEYADKAIVSLCDIDENAELPAIFGIRSVPTVLFIKNGQVVDKSIGASSKATLEEKLKSLL